jgi:pseudouridine synthase
VHIESHLYIILNKPRGYVSDTDETSEHPPAVELVQVPERLYPAGRLDWNSEGLLFLTNDGELAFRLTHPRYEHTKEYLVLVAGEPDEKALASLRRGISSEGEWLRADKIETMGRHQAYGEAGRDETWLKFILHEGKKRHIRRMCSAVGHPVKRLIRTRIATLKLGGLKQGKWRALTAQELAELKTSLAARPKARRPRPERHPRSAPDKSSQREEHAPFKSHQTNRKRNASKHYRD